MNLTCIIVEDEPLAYSKIEGFINRVPFLELSAGFENAMDAQIYLKENCIDIVFLDIQMDKLTGIQMLETMQQRPYIIITSAYAQYALKGYELQVFDYLLKPYSFERFLAAVNKVYDDITLKNKYPDNNIHIFVKTEYRLENVNTNDILYIEGMQGYLKIVTDKKKIMTKQGFKNLLEQLPVNKFIQVHKSWIVNISKIESVERNRIKIASEYIPVGETYKEAFYKLIKS